MGDVGDSNVSDENSQPLTIADQLSTLSINGDKEEPRVDAPEMDKEKDPRRIARKYQIDLCKKALEENIIVYLETGCGKTHIAVLLIYEMSNQIRKPQKDICVFLAPTVALVEQQARVIEDSTDFKVGTYCGSSKRLRGHSDWEKEVEQYEILVMTPQVLLHNLSHCFIRIESIALLIFDECHYAQIQSDHPYAEIMKVFYKPDAVKLPRIFGMTASPKHGRGASLISLETLLHAKIYTVEDKEELEQFVSSPVVKVYYYGTTADNSFWHFSVKLEDIKHQNMSTLNSNTEDRNSVKSTKKALQRLHGNVKFCLENLGLWGALQASQILIKDPLERSELIELDGQLSDDTLGVRYLTQVASILASECRKGSVDGDLSCVEALKAPFFSWKLLRLIGILSIFGLQLDMKCIIFVNRIITARSLSLILQKLRFLSSWRCGFLVGVHSGLKSMSRKTTNVILEKFRSGELNLLVATKVGEEGLDIQTCCLVIRFDLPETVASFIQSRGRARMPQSEYAFLVDRQNEKELNLIQNFLKDEVQMNHEISSRSSTTPCINFEEITYRVDSTGATISSGSSVSLLHRYCSKLPHDEYFNPKPQFFYFDDSEGTICHIILPSNAAVNQVVGAPQSSTEASKKDACLRACKELHKVGALTDYLLPDQSGEVEEVGQDSSDSDSDSEEGSRKELQEMQIPAALREPWTILENTVRLNSYFIKFTPRPADRQYKKFGLFLKALIPGEANNMKLELRLARGRTVMTELVTSGVAEFVDEEISLAEKFQEMCLKVVLDRSDLTSNFVSLGKQDSGDSSSSTFYFMLPVVHDAIDKMTVDWELIRRCLSSPIFRTPLESEVCGVSTLSNSLHLVNGSIKIDEIVDSLVYMPCKDIFYFVTQVVTEKNCYDIYKESTTHVQHYKETCRIHLLHPYQPLLKAKQLFCLDNLLRKKGHSDSREKEEHFVDLPPELCQLKIIGFSKDIGSSLSLLPSIMHRLESLLVAVELKHKLAASFPEGAEVTAPHVLEALTTEKCHERFSLERLEVLGDAFLKFAVGRHLFLLHDVLDEGQLTRKRSKIVNNSNLCKLAILSNLQVYIRDQSFEPSQFFAFGRRCSVLCNEETKKSVHSFRSLKDGRNMETRCCKSHHWLHKKTVADVVEALVGAFLVDSGFMAATAFLKWIGIRVDFEASQVTNICSASKIFMPLGSQIDISALEKLLGYQFRHKGLLLQAFVHPSYSSHFGGCYQRLEFLGDAVLDYLITSYLYSVYPKLKPGQLSDLRSMSVNNNSFADIAVNRSFHKFIFCDSSGLRESMSKYAEFIGTGALEKGQVEDLPCPKALGDLLESSVGAILLDTGFDLGLVWEIMLSFLDPVKKFSSIQLNPIRELLELCQFYRWDLKFPSVKKEGKFSVAAEVEGTGVSVTSCAMNVNRKAAKRIAAKQTFLLLKGQGHKTKTRPLEEVLKSSHKLEAKLIGNDEVPIPVNDSSLVGQFEGLSFQEPSQSDHFKKMLPVGIEVAKNSHMCDKSSGRPTSECSSSSSQFMTACENSVRVNSLRCQSSTCENGIRDDDPVGYPSTTSSDSSCYASSQTKGRSRKVSSKSRLYEICAANGWKSPVFECCNETGPSHLKEFIFKVEMEIEEASGVILECIGDPNAKKKAAAEHAADGALWYLKRAGYW